MVPLKPRVEIELAVAKSKCKITPNGDVKGITMNKEKGKRSRCLRAKGERKPEERGKRKVKEFIV